MFRPINLSWKNSLILLFLLICPGLQYIYSQSPSPQKAPEAVLLELNKPVEGEISGTQKIGFQITLAANQYIKILIEQGGIDLLARLYGADDKLLADFDAEMQPSGTETVEFATKTAGNYRLVIEPKYKLLPGGKYKIQLAKSEAASEKENTRQEARDLAVRAFRLYTAGNYDDAEQAIKRAIEINTAEFGLNNQLMVLNLTQLARITDAIGDYDEAEKLNQQALAIEKKIFGPDSPHTANTLNYIALNYNHKDDYPKAIEYHEQALAMRERIFGENHPAVAASLLNLGVVYDSLGDRLKASELYQKSLDIFEKTTGAETYNVAAILNNIGKIYNDLEDYKKAEPYLLRTTAILEKIYAPDNPAIFNARSNLAECQAGLGNLDKSESLYRSVLEFREKTVGENHPLTAHVAFNLGNLYEIKRDFVKSEAYYRRSLQIRENVLGPENISVAATLSGLAMLMAEKGDIGQSLKFQQRANEIDEQNMSLNLAIGSERQKIAYINSLFDRTNQNFVIQGQFAPDNPLAIELAVTTALRQKGRVMDAVSNNLKAIRQQLNPQDQSLIDNLNETTRKLAELIINGRDETPLPEYESKIKALNDTRENLEDDLSRRAAGFYSKSQAVTLPMIQASIPVNSALIEFVIYTPRGKDGTYAPDEPRYVAYILQNRGEVKQLDLGPVKEIDAAIVGFRQALRDPKRKDTGQISRLLDEKIMKPVRTLLGDSKQLLISPDGNLNLIPFEALVDEQNRYLIENYSVTYLTSGRDLLRMKIPRESKNKPLLIANPLFGPPLASRETKTKDAPKQASRKDKGGNPGQTRSLSDTYFAPLTGTMEEARSIREVFPDTTVFTGGQATESALKQTIAPRLLHIATHGFFLEDTGKDKSKTENPLLRSGLALAGANQRKNGVDDGILTGLEASGLNLWGTKLVVLSACDTGIGEVKNGEGVYGLRRAFMMAGAESLIMSLWPVSDTATRELMTGYYKNLKQGMGRGAALRQVQLEMLRNPERRHPFYWASFIQSGEWANLDGKR